MDIHIHGNPGRYISLSTYQIYRLLSPIKVLYHSPTR